MKPFVSTALGILFLLGALTPVARANLIGDGIKMGLGGPQTSSVILDYSTSVSAGTGDSVDLLYGLIIVNPEASSILVDFNLNNTFTVAPFTGLIIGDIDDLITRVTVETNFSGWTDSRLAFGPHHIEANWQGLAVTTSTYFNLYLNPAAEAAATVPETGASLALLAGGLLGLASLRRRFAPSYDL